MTSWDVTRFRIRVLEGTMRDCLVLRSRVVRDFSIKISSSELSLKPYSWDQYHWCPEIFIVKSGALISSMR